MNRKNTRFVPRMRPSIFLAVVEQSLWWKMQNIAQSVEYFFFGDLRFFKLINLFICVFFFDLRFLFCLSGFFFYFLGFFFCLRAFFLICVVFFLFTSFLFFYWRSFLFVCSVSIVGYRMFQFRGISVHTEPEEIFVSAR